MNPRQKELVEMLLKQAGYKEEGKMYVNNKIKSAFSIGELFSKESIPITIPSGSVEDASKKYVDDNSDSKWNKAAELERAFLAGAAHAQQPYSELLETVKIALSYRDFGVLNEYLHNHGEKKIPAPPSKPTEIKKFMVVKDHNDYLHIWTKREYERYIEGAVEVGAGSAVRIIVSFNGTEDYLSASQPPAPTVQGLNEEQLSAIFIDYIQNEHRNVGKGCNHEEYVLAQDIGSIISKIITTQPPSNTEGQEEQDKKNNNV